MVACGMSYCPERPPPHFITKLLASLFYQIAQNMVCFWCTHADSVHEVCKYKN